MKLADLKNKSILILGFGREGKSSLNFLNKHFPEKKIGIADQSFGENYLDKLNDYQVVIKSPGIPYLPKIKKAKENGKIITSATDIFLENCKGKVIGVTGTKGKSTTASLIYEVLKSGGLNVHLIGNIGKPALDLLRSRKFTSFMLIFMNFQTSLNMNFINCSFSDWVKNRKVSLMSSFLYMLRAYSLLYLKNMRKL